MSKYIDAEKLKERIEKLDMESCISEEESGFYYAIDSVLEVLNSLQQEQKSIQDAELTGFENALFTAFSYAWQSYLRGEEVNVVQWAKEHSAELLEAARCQQEQPEESKLPSKRTRVNYAICKLQAFKPLREAIVLDGYVYDEGKCYKENLLNYIHAIPESRLAEIRSYLKEKGWWPYDDDFDWEQEQPEVDLEKELNRYLRGEFQQTAGGNFNNYIQVARHFYELGLKAREK